MAAWRISCGGWIIAGVLAVGDVAAAAGHFELPKEGPVAFRRDRLPIEVDLMTSLSSGLVSLSHAQRRENAADRRIVAQMLALALALNPANDEARVALAAAAKGAQGGRAGKRELERSRTEIWGALKWLRSPEAGPDGQALAACLGDVISMADPTHPDAASLLEKGEKGAWKSWVADLKAFDQIQPTEKEVVAENMPTPENGTPQTPQVPLPQAKLQLESTSILTPLWGLDKDTGDERLQLTTVGMKASILPSPPPEAPVVKPMTFAIDFTLENAQVNRMNRTLHAVLVKQYGALPAGSQVTLNLGEETAYLPARDRDALSGSAAVLLDAALSGKAPAGIVIGRLEPDGSFKSPPDVWDRLRALSAGPGGRLVIPADAAEYLPWILALENPEFFLKYDVLLASNHQELVERSAAATESPLTEILARFQEVRAKGATLPIGQYVTNRFVRQRLAELSVEAPYFASPKLLGIQGAGERPTRISRKILAFELRGAMQPLGWLRGKAAADIDLAKLDKSYDSARAQVDSLEKYSEDRDLLASVREMTTTLRTFSRAQRLSLSREREAVAAAEAFVEMRESINTTLSKLNAVIGEVEVADDADADGQ
ncbi:MAG: hypothetical protein KF712_07455 [Akkermansiaceae bacterium]|nr:hypothetical protein [Akkermansiaceae bacterium]